MYGISKLETFQSTDFYLKEDQIGKGPYRRPAVMLAGITPFAYKLKAVKEIQLHR